MMIKISYELRIFNGVTLFFKKVFAIGKDINVDGYVLSLEWIRRCIY